MVRILLFLLIVPSLWSQWSFFRHPGIRGAPDSVLISKPLGVYSNSIFNAPALFNVDAGEEFKIDFTNTTEYLKIFGGVIEFYRSATYLWNPAAGGAWVVSVGGTYQYSNKRLIVNDKNVHLFTNTTNDLGASGMLILYNAAQPPTTPATNAAGFYVSSGEMYVYDGAGNATLISPHDSTGRWIFYSKNLKSGREIKVNMEELILDLAKFMSNITGKDYIEISEDSDYK
ncbi:MAG: hypothetical protein GXO75_08445 [Calditrichaeota bacterium]|nr:hypothetical protein [Calditrichota bacterium]